MLGDASEAFGTGTALLTDCTFASPAGMSSMRVEDPEGSGTGTGAAGNAAVAAERAIGGAIGIDALSP